MLSVFCDKSVESVERRQRWCGRGPTAHSAPGPPSELIQQWPERMNCRENAWMTPQPPWLNSCSIHWLCFRNLWWWITERKLFLQMLFNLFIIHISTGFAVYMDVLALLSPVKFQLLFLYLFILPSIRVWTYSCQCCCTVGDQLNLILLIFILQRSLNRSHILPASNKRSSLESHGLFSYIVYVLDGSGRL